jgi:hypothetical protein
MNYSNLNCCVGQAYARSCANLITSQSVRVPVLNIRFWIFTQSNLYMKGQTPDDTRPKEKR